MQEIRSTLEALSEPEFQRFSSSLLPGVEDVLGVRLPKLRALARKIVRGDWRGYLETASDDSFEERMLQGMVIGYADAPLPELLERTGKFVAKLDNWSVCDSFCASLKWVKGYQEEVWHFLQPYLADSREYPVRFGVVMLLDYYLDDRYIDQVLDRLDAVRHEGYYVRMAVAWALSMCYLRFPERTLGYLTGTCSLDDFTYNKALQKIVESRCVTQETKQYIRSLKRKG